MPTVSVIIPAFNAARTIAATIESVRSQTQCAIEILVIDDGSTDETARIAAACDPNVRVLSQPHSGGPARGRNHGVKQARADWIAFFDSDDLMEPDKLERQLRAAGADPTIDVVFSDFRVIDEAGATLDERFVERYRDFRSILRPTEVANVWCAEGREIYPKLIAHNFIGTSSVLVQKDTLQKVGPFDEELPNGDDREMWYRLARNGGTFCFVDEICHRYRKRRGSITASGGRRFPAQIEVLQRQRQFLTLPVEKTLYCNQLHDLYLRHGRSLLETGRRRDARQAYLRAYRTERSRAALRGLLRSWLPF